MPTPLPDSFALAPDAQALLTRLVTTCDEFAHLGEARLLCVASQRTPVLHGAPCAALIGLTTVHGGPFRHLYAFLVAQLSAPVFEGDEPDFCVLIDAALWGAMDPEEQERLVYHELCHVIAKEHPETGAPMFSDDGRPALKLRPHDFEFFDQEVRRYGPMVCGLDAAAVAIAEGHRDAVARRKPRRVA